MKKVLSLLLIAVFTLSLFGGGAITPIKTFASESKTIKDYVDSETIDANNVFLTDSLQSFDKAFTLANPIITMEINGKATFGGDFNTSPLYEIHAKEAGALILQIGCKGSSLSDMDIFFYSDKNGSVPRRVVALTDVGYYVEKNEVKTEISMNQGDQAKIEVLLDKDDTIYFKLGGGVLDVETIVYAAFVPTDSVLKVSKITVNSDGTIDATIKALISNNIISSRGKESYTTAKQSIDTKLNEFTIKGSKGQETTLSFKKVQKAAAVCYVHDETDEILYFITNIDLTKAADNSLQAVKKPSFAKAGTNVVVGYGEPNATIYVKYNKKTYKSTSNEDGLYMVVTAKLKASEKYSVWQKVNGKTSKKYTGKVTK